MRNRRGLDPLRLHQGTVFSQYCTVHQKSESPRGVHITLGSIACVNQLTGIPHEQDMPAPVTTTIFLLLTTDDESVDIVRRVWGSELEPESATETVMAGAMQRDVEQHL